MSDDPALPVLVIDDEADIRQLVCLSLSRVGVDTHAAANLSEARELLARYDFSCCLTDMRLPDGNGVDFVAELAGTHPALPVAVITAHGQMSAAVEAMKNGAFDFVSKPVDLRALRALVAQAVRLTSQAPTHSTTDGSPSELPADELAMGERLVGRSPPMAALRQRILKVARTNAPVWITGESGTGKELIARLIHANGPRADGPFVAINCGAIPADLVESELFGHRKGAFTGAHEDKDGLFRAADGGTLLLDEVAELPLAVQVKLLRAIQERKIRPVGVSEERAVNVRLLSASHVDLESMVESGSFRQDLYYRLNVICIRSPSLRDRPGDLPALCDAILARLAERDGSAPARLTPDALATLNAYGFPGNVRELENVLERAVALSGDRVIDRDGLELSTGPDAARSSGSSARVDGSADVDADAERAAIAAALERTRWNRRRAADELGLSYRQLRYRIARFGLDSGADDDDRAA